MVQRHPLIYIRGNTEHVHIVNSYVWVNNHVQEKYCSVFYGNNLTQTRYTVTFYVHFFLFLHLER